MKSELETEQLLKRIDPGSLGIEDTREIEELEGIIGQDRAVRALKFGIQMKGEGFNVYVAGPPGIGKMTSVESFLEEVAGTREAPSDWCYVYNFADSYEPRALKLDAGWGEALRRDMEHASRMAGHKNKLSTNFGSLADVLREANYWADDDDNDDKAMIKAEHIDRAIEERIYRSSMLAERIREMIDNGSLLIDVEGSVAGQVNGLAIIMLGDYEFGRPNRITATVTVGREGIVDIEREAKMGGPIHSKGVLIMSGYLTGIFAREMPLAISATIVFEQSYEGVEGDSASSAELYAILSALADAPIRQDIAVTGSVNQKGVVQAVGGINDKIEGFFDVCSQIGLTGEQGVIIPDANVQNLMLRKDVVEAVESGKFHVWSVGTIDEGIEILTGVEAGERDASGNYPEDSINGRVMKRLQSYQKVLKELAPGQNGGNNTHAGRTSARPARPDESISTR